MTRREPGAAWPALGYRFEGLRHRGLHDGLLSGDAYDLLLARAVSLRVLTRHAAPHERELLERESEALGLIGRHPHVVSLLDRLSLSDGEVLVLERLAPLVPAVAPMPPADAVALVVRLCGAVETAHRAGLVHAAVQPAELHLSEDGRTLLAGFVRRLGDAQPPVLRAISPHTPPELLLGDPAVEATDVYGLGSTLYELLAGHAAYRSYDGESVAALSLRILTGPVPPIGRRDLPFALIDVINWTLAVDPALRPPSAAWLAEELGRIERSQGWARTPVQVGTEPAEPPRLARSDGPRHRAG
ncbi:hypothetical protein [Jatrophihabitans sp.]|uniref:protein kinase domain-containing protein n=1 Tax=Jatrophihabitans sp. TaxID=1932789 RepID=UPI0030C761B3|nr:protein kinase/transcriptional regulator, LuxR family protein [Jatrophihabitans sp.]